MHFLFKLLIINFLYMFRALPADVQKALHKRQFEYCVRVMSVSCISFGLHQDPDVANWHNMQYTVQPVAIRYTNWFILAHYFIVYTLKILIKLNLLHILLIL
jgi:hypothetical protein